LIVYACKQRKNTVFNRNFQNLTAQYNILFHANENLREIEEDIEMTYQDDYGKVIPVFQEPNSTISGPFSGKLESCVHRAHTIINDKPFSRYADEAYLILGKANFYKAEFFTAIEYFNYVQRTYPKSTTLVQESLVWESRALLQLNRLADANDTLALALKKAKRGGVSNKTMSETFAALAELYIRQENYFDAEACLTTALSLNSYFNRNRRIRWTFVLGQLYDRLDKSAAAQRCYNQVVHSNASFEMAFNAELHRIKFDEYYRPDVEKMSYRLKRLRRLLKNDNNIDLRDQIYYQIANVYLNDQRITEAITNFKSSVRVSVNNNQQKGVSYLALADLYFDKLSDYSKAHDYYDSALVVLPTSFPAYHVIKNKNQHIEPLAHLLDSLNKDEMFLELALLPAEQKASRLNALVAIKISQINQFKNAAKGDSVVVQKFLNKTDESKFFYFYNTAAVTEGYVEFKRKWGNRKLEDNWRRSNKPMQELGAGADAINDNNTLERTTTALKADEIDTVKILRDYSRQIPQKEEEQDSLQRKIVHEYYQIGNFYRDVLEDKLGAIKVYEQLLYKYPYNSYRAVVYYNLFRLYAGRDLDKMDYYRSHLIQEFPESRYTKIILDPNYLKKEDNLAINVAKAYHEAKSLYDQKRYQEAFHRLNAFTISATRNQLITPSFAYLTAISAAHFQPIDSLISAFKRIEQGFPEDTLVTVRVRQQLRTIEKNNAWFASRLFAIMDVDTAMDSNPHFNPMRFIPIASPSSRDTAHIANEQQVYNFADSVQYHFVLYLTGEALNPTVFRAKIGQFNRSNYSHQKLKHNIKEIDETHQMIYVEEIGELEEAINYYENIFKNLQSFVNFDDQTVFIFIVAEDEFEKLTDQESIQRYINYFKKNF